MSTVARLVRTAGLLFSVAALALSGCGTSDGPERYDLSGKATFKGQPIPFGEITLTPDAAQGNKGPGSTATIKDGAYRTEPGMGVVGGPYVVRIMAFDGVAVGESLEGSPLLQQPYEEAVVLESKDSVKDFDVPK
jgi:hypothetical protein